MSKKLLGKSFANEKVDLVCEAIGHKLKLKTAASPDEKPSPRSATISEVEKWVFDTIRGEVRDNENRKLAEAAKIPSDFTLD